ncbi:hypothetical protein N5079_26110 [Planotetraspora sp. A-T 1434]|uniref:hypothetical protein n=1 Tax=Planotetraspora sp. A-T 1434 TaxID=2979219 RepID=UPI0021C1DE1F|nr:hypothetical protein [Planotetraspora sp. A-T 1434]MCT9933694.1 hypothetical protein [Planotetraspora sp. A-T 1434]
MASVTDARVSSTASVKTWPSLDYAVASASVSAAAVLLAVTYRRRRLLVADATVWWRRTRLTREGDRLNGRAAVHRAR